jgi:SulP family sulfate permease
MFGGAGGGVRELLKSAYRRARQTWIADPAGGFGPLLRDWSAGVVASLVTLAHCLSFSALIFAGELSAGLPMALWGFMISTALVALLTGAVSTLPPLLCGPRNPVVAVMSVLALTVSAAAAAKGMTGGEAARHVLVALSIASLVTGVLIWLLGVFRLGQAVRFIPFPVIGGFLAASGLLLVAGGIRVGMGARFDPDLLFADGGVLLRLFATAMIAAVLLGTRRLRLGAMGLPIIIIAAAIAINLALWLLQARTGWYLSMAGGALGWSPLESISGIDWDILGSASVEIATIAAVSVAALLLDVSSLEVQRRAQADMDAEFRTNGGANLAVVAVGGLTVGVALNPSRLLDALGGRGRGAGLAGGLFVGLVLVSGLDIASLVPRPVLGGLLVFLGAGVVVEALQVPGERSRPEFALTLLIMGAIVGLGYLTGLVLGVVGACLLFAARYSRIDVIRRHVTRAQFAAPVERRLELARLLAEEGSRIHVLWLTGFVFFGSSNRLYEDIRQITSSTSAGRRWVVLDCSGLTGIDASAVLSFQKLGNWAKAADVVLVFAGASPSLLAELTAGGLFGGQHGRHFATRSEALEWSEDELLSSLQGRMAVEGPAAFETWLSREIGKDAANRLIEGDLKRRELAAGEVVCALGAQADTIELVVAGSVAVIVPGLGERPIRVRRMTGGTVVGEMGFFRGLPRAASVIAEEPAIVYIMTRNDYERLIAEDPGLGAKFLGLVIRTLSDRVDAANREITALL